MKNKNCPNCGAPYDIVQYKCPYCGTLYLDLSMINFDEQEPLFLTIKQNNILLTQKVIPQTASFINSADTIYATNSLGNKLLSVTTNMQYETNIQFIAVPIDNEKRIYAIARQE